MRERKRHGGRGVLHRVVHIVSRGKGVGAQRFVDLALVERRGADRGRRGERHDGQRVVHAKERILPGDALIGATPPCVEELPARIHLEGSNREIERGLRGALPRFVMR